jgi:hypothetical protein
MTLFVLALIPIAFLVLALILIRKEGFYLYVWIPLVVNCVGWTCVGSYVFFRILLILDHSRYPDAWDGLVGMGVIPVVMVTGCLLLTTIATICVWPPRPAWKPRLVVGPLIVAVILFVLPTLLWLPGFARTLLGE